MANYEDPLDSLVNERHRYEDKKEITIHEKVNWAYLSRAAKYEMQKIFSYSLKGGGVYWAPEGYKYLNLPEEYYNRFVGTWAGMNTNYGLVEKIRNRYYKMADIAFLLLNNRWPEGEIAYKDGNPFNLSVDNIYDSDENGNEIIVKDYKYERQKILEEREKKFLASLVEYEVRQACPEERGMYSLGTYLGRWIFARKDLTKIKVTRVLRDHLCRLRANANAHAYIWPSKKDGHIVVVRRGSNQPFLALVKTEREGKELGEEFYEQCRRHDPTKFNRFNTDI